MNLQTLAVCRPLLSVPMCALFLLQQLNVPLRAQETRPKSLNIVIVQGDGAVNNVRERVAREPIVEVQDENHKPIGGAVVTFLLPNSGPSGTFLNGSRILTVTTDQAGRAVATGMQPNTINGPMQIRISANFQGMTTNATITQTNAVGAAAGSSAGSAAGGVAGGGGGLSGGVIAAIVAVAAGAAIGAAVALGGGSKNGTSTPPPTVTPTTIGLGNGTVGHP